MPWFGAPCSPDSPPWPFALRAHGTIVVQFLQRLRRPRHGEREPGFGLRGDVRRPTAEEELLGLREDKGDSLSPLSLLFVFALTSMLLDRQVDIYRKSVDLHKEGDGRL